MTPLVVDIYHGDSTPDWAALKSAGVVGVIHKATEGLDFIDPEYASRRQAALAAGLLWGAYHFLRPGDMAQQAAFFVATAAPTTTTLLAADHEDSGVSLDDLKSFLSAVSEKASLDPVLYSGSVIKDQLGNRSDPELASYRLWLAEYCNPPPKWPTATWPQWWLWQYTDTGQVGGCTGNTDLDTYQGTADELAAEWTGVAPAPATNVVTVAINLPAGVTLQLTVNGVPVAYG